MEKNKDNDSNLTKFRLLMEEVDDLPWSPRNVPYHLLNPCIQPYKEIEKVMFDLHDEGKIKKVIIEHGSGDLIPFNASVYLHYSCYVEGRKTPFDSSVIRSPFPKHYQLGGGYLFSGFELAVRSMKKKEIAQFSIHPDYAYGKMGCPPRIPGNAVIMMTILVTGFIDCGYVTLLSRNKEVEFLPFSEKFNIAKSHNALAIDSYKNLRIKMAFHHFREAQYILDVEADSKTEEEDRQNFLRKSLVNQITCLSHPDYFKPKKILEIAKKAEEEVPDISKKETKFHYCLGIAYTHLKDFKAAEQSFKKAQYLLQSVQQLPSLSKAIKILKEMTRTALKEEKTMWKDAFNKLGYSAIPEKVESETEDIIQMREIISDSLLKFLEADQINTLTLSNGFTKVERQMLANEANKLQLKYEEILVDNKLKIEIKKCI